MSGYFQPTWLWNIQIIHLTASRWSFVYFNRFVAGVWVWNQHRHIGRSSREERRTFAWRSLQTWGVYNFLLVVSLNDVHLLFWCFQVFLKKENFLLLLENFFSGCRKGVKESLRKLQELRNSTVSLTRRNEGKEIYLLLSFKSFLVNYYNNLYSVSYSSLKHDELVKWLMSV